MWNGRTIAVVLPTYRERNSIAAVVKGFEALGRRRRDRGRQQQRGGRHLGRSIHYFHREVFETRQGYGAAIQRGLREVDADLVCVCEPDATFDPGDLLKLLPYSVECGRGVRLAHRVDVHLERRRT